MAYPISSDAAVDDLSVLSAEPVGVWRTHQLYEDLLACSTEPLPPKGAELPSASESELDRARRPWLSACMIVRNEEKRLRPCLESIRGLVDEIVVVDTGSSDRTTDIAREFGAFVSDFPWMDDFAAARNEARRLSRGEWILQIDADETLRTFSRRELRVLLSDESKAAYFVLFRRRARLTQNWQARLFRNHPDLRYQGAIHEAITPQCLRLVTGRGLGKCRLELEHTGYDGDLYHKHVRNLPLLLKQLQENPEHPDKVFIWGHLADIHEELGNSALADCASEHSVALLRRKGKLHPVDSAVYLRLLTRRVSQRGKISSLLKEAFELFPDNLHLLWILGRWRMNEGQYEKAIPCFEKLIERGQAGDYDHWVAYDRRLFDVLSYDSLAVCHFRLGRYKDARSHFGAAACHAPDSTAYDSKIKLCCSSP